MMLNTATQSAAASAAATAGATSATPVQNADARPDQAAQAGGAQPFAAWFGDQAKAAALAVQVAAPLPADGATDDAAAPALAAAPAVADDAGDDTPAAAPQDGALLAAMAMPLMPLSAAQVAQAVQAAQPAGAQSGAQDSRPVAAAAPSAATRATATQAAGAPATATMAASTSADRAAVDVDSAAQPSARRAATTDRGPALPQAQAVPAAAPARADQARPDAMPAARFAIHAQADSGSSAGAEPGAEHAGAGNGAPAGSDRAVLASAAAAQPVAGAPLADTVKLAGPPTAWRQSLQEALGERLNVQVGKNMEQAVIRLEPPQLGRIDIAIRHSAGTLEVNISATNGEVLRQLQTVSDSLRSDLSQRQFTDVAVTVTPAPKNGAAPFGDPQQGRGRQQDRDQDDKQPGRGLAEASNNPSAFSLNGRD